VLTTTTKFDATVKAAWVAALRGGQYRQARRQLSDPARGTFDVLGVLCDVVRDRVRGEWLADGSFGVDGSIGDVDDAFGSWSRDAVPPLVAEAVGLDDVPAVRVGLLSGSQRRLVAGEIAGGVTYVSLSALNDAGMTFGEMADLIERGL
jgi:hypothetical protein